MTKDELIKQLNSNTKTKRLAALRELYKMHKSGELEMPETGNNVNNHIHTTYSFSPYSPTKAVYLSWTSGLATAGIMDHDSVGGAREFIEAAKILSFPVTVGLECRCNMKGTGFEGKTFNNPDQKSVAYMAIHGIPHQKIDEVERFFAPVREKRNRRNRRMLERLNIKLKPYGLWLDFDNDVIPLSQHHEGGSVTERTIMYALSVKLAGNEMSRQFLLGIFKSFLVESMYIDADEELIEMSDYMMLCEKTGAIATYPYLGDIGISVTGDKKTQAFEDAFLDELLSYMKSIGVRAVAYMPTRNNDNQLKRIMELCTKNEFFQICGEDINSPLQKFICDKLETPELKHLIDSAWALIGHELACGEGVSKGMFTPETIKSMPELCSRIVYFADYARKAYKRYAQGRVPYN